MTIVEDSSFLRNNTVSLSCLALKIKALHSIRMLGTICPVTAHIPEDLNFDFIVHYFMLQTQFDH